MTTITLVADTAPVSFGRLFARAFESLGHVTTIIDEWGLYRSGSALARNRVLHRLAWRWLARPFQQRLVDAIATQQPDLVLIFKGLLVAPGTVSVIKAALPTALVFNYNPDNPFNTWHRGSSNPWVRRAIPEFDAYFLWGEFLREPMRQAKGRRFEYLPFAYDPALHHELACSATEQAELSSDVAFVGTWDQEREQWLRPICELGVTLKIWGNSWERASAAIRAHWTGREAILDTFAKICGAAKINLNFVRKQNGPAHNMRTFEVPACGGFALATRTPEHQRLFVEGREIALFSTPNELCQQIKYYLAHDSERARIAAAGHQKVVAGRNTYRDRAAQIMAVYDDIRTTQQQTGSAPDH